MSKVVKVELISLLIYIIGLALMFLLIWMGGGTRSSQDEASAIGLLTHVVNFYYRMTV
jgi:hypothetical protein